MSENGRENEFVMSGFKWQAGPGMLLCQQQRVVTSSVILTPDNGKSKEGVFKVLSVGPGIKGIKEGDYICTQKIYTNGTSIPGRVFVRIEDVWGRLVPEDAPNSAVETWEEAALRQRPMSFELDKESEPAPGTPQPWQLHPR